MIRRRERRGRAHRGRDAVEAVGRSVSPRGRRGMGLSGRLTIPAADAKDDEDDDDGGERERHARRDR